MVAVLLVSCYVDYLFSPVSHAVFVRLQAEMSTNHEALLTADGGVPERVEHYHVNASLVLCLVFWCFAINRREVYLHEFFLACLYEIGLDVGIFFEELEDVPS